MNIRQLILSPYELPLPKGAPRSGALLEVIDSFGSKSCSDLAPLPGWSQETLEQAIQQMKQTQKKILEIDWKETTCLEEIRRLALFPSASFALESALLSLLSPLPSFSPSISAFFMGSLEEIFSQAKESLKKGRTSAKLKVSQLSFSEARKAILELKDLFSLRIDVNRAWTKEESLRFFGEFPLDTFDYVEEPFQNPLDLADFPHPLAIDESFPQVFSLKDLEKLPTLKALVYKPTLQGGMAYCKDAHLWCKERNISFVLSSSFESDVGLFHIASMAHRLKITSPLGIGTYTIFLGSTISSKRLAERKPS